MEPLIALVAFSFVSSVTPGPNNILLWASGASFGLGRTLPHVIGTALGIGTMAMAAAVGASALLAAVPELATVMKVAGSAYLVFLALQITRVGTLEHANVGRPLGVAAAAGFQLLNPKAWIFALGAVTTFRFTGMPSTVGGGVVALTMMVVIVPTALLWAGAGGALGRFIQSPRARRAMSIGLAAMLVATIALVWV